MRYSSKRNLKKEAATKIDASYRKNLNIEYDNLDDYDEDYFLALNALVEEQHKKIKEKYYSSNACIERIQNRTFREILYAKIYSMLNSSKK